MDEQRTIVIGISGCSSSGKTTLARLLRDIFPETFIIHEDDFYKPEAELPIKDGLVDWDCPEAISMPDLEAALTHVHKTGTFPPHVLSKEDLNSVGPCPATPSQITACAARVRDWLRPGQPGSRIFPPADNNQQQQQQRKKTRICLLDGFLLYGPAPSPLARVTALLDIKLFLRVSKQKALRRREARDGYVTLEGFWKDPPGYVEKIVWPNYVEAHRWMFEGGEVEGGRLDEKLLKREGIFAQTGKGEDVEFGEILEWAVGVVMAELERVVLGRREDGEVDGEVDGEL
ncbi:hypothetical protein VTI74DRAFT_6628 [Chaetomium olivicolor]